MGWLFMGICCAAAELRPCASLRITKRGWTAVGEEALTGCRTSPSSGAYQTDLDSTFTTMQAQIGLSR